jgi:CheY-like chemotaxis protein
VANLLVVDDDADVAELLAAVLESRGHSVRVARDGREGLRLVAEGYPDLVLLDVEMPFVTGPEMSREMLFRDRGQEEIPIVLLSAVPNLFRVAARVGTPYFLRKPYDAAAVSALVDSALAERRPPLPLPEEP